MNDQARGLRPGTPAVPGTVPSSPKWLVVTGGKGGVGKTVLAANLATLAARSGRRTLLVDLDTGTANLHVHFRRSPRHTIEDAATSRCSAFQARTLVEPNLEALFGTSGPSALLDGAPTRMARAFEVIAEAAREFDLVLCDTGSSLNPLMFEAVRRAHVQLTVTGSDPASVTDTYALLKALDHAELDPPSLVVNNVADLQEAVRTATRLAKTARTYLGHGVELAGWVRNDRAVPRSIVEQRPLCRRDGLGAAGDLQALFARTVALLAAANQRPSTSPSFV